MILFWSASTTKRLTTGNWQLAKYNMLHVTTDAKEKIYFLSIFIIAFYEKQNISHVVN